MSTLILGEGVQTARREVFRSVGATPEGDEQTIPTGILPSFPPSTREVQPGGNSPMESTVSPQEVFKGIDPLIRLSRGQLTPRRFKVLQQWEGIITEVDEDSAMADLLDLTDPTKPVEIVEIPIAEISEADHHLLQPGCVFYWIIGHETSVGGQKNRVSEIRIRRNPEWSQNALDSIKARGKGLYHQFKDRGEDSTTKNR